MARLALLALLLIPRLSHAIAVVTGNPGAFTQGIVWCSSKLQDIHCYADAVACEMGGNVGGNFMRPNVQPSDGSVIRTFWNGQEIRWNTNDANGQFTFGGFAAGLNWPEEGANLTPPLRTNASLKCDVGHADSINGCQPAQRKLEFTRNGVNWVYLFRKRLPYGENWGNIAILGYKQTEREDDQARSPQNAVGWFNRFVKNRNNENVPQLPVPVPGGRWGSSETGRNLAVSFFDTVANHQTLSVPVRDASTARGMNCITCHGSGPVLDVPWYHEHAGNSRGDDAIPYFSAANLHSYLTFFKPEGNSCTDCHGYWGKGTATCNRLAREYTTVQENSTFVSRFRKGHIRLGLTDGAAAAPATLNRDARRTHLMPAPHSFTTVNAWNVNLQADVNQLVACCGGTGTGCGPDVRGRPPVYYPEQATPPTESYRQRVPGPDEPINVTVGTWQNCNAARTQCDVRVNWEDPNDRYNAPTHYFTAYGAVNVVAAYCTGGSAHAPEYAAGTPTVISGFRRRFTEVYRITCNEGVRQVRICGSHCSLTVDSGAHSVGVLASIPNLPCPGTPTPTSTPTPTPTPRPPTATPTPTAAPTVTPKPTVTTYFTLTVSRTGTGSGNVQSVPAGINCGSDCTENYASGTTVTLTASASSGSVFAGWSGACSGTSLTCSVVLSISRSVTATFNLSATTPPFSSPTATPSPSPSGSGSSFSTGFGIRQMGVGQGVLEGILSTVLSSVVGAEGAPTPTPAPQAPSATGKTATNPKSFIMAPGYPTTATATPRPWDPMTESFP